MHHMWLPVIACMPSHALVCQITVLGADSWSCVPNYSPVCWVVLCAKSWSCVLSHGPVCWAMTLCVESWFYVPSHDSVCQITALCACSSCIFRAHETKPYVVAGPGLCSKAKLALVHLLACRRRPQKAGLVLSQLPSDVTSQLRKRRQKKSNITRVETKTEMSCMKHQTQPKADSELVL